MQNRLKELRLYFGLNPQAMAEYLDCAVEQLETWENATSALVDEVAARYVRRFGVSRRWLAGDDAPMWGAALEQLRADLKQHITQLSGSRLVEMLTATTGERIAYAVNWMRKTNPELCTLECMACWLGLSPGSTNLLLRKQLDPGSPVVLRASDLTGISDRWFRSGPIDQLTENEKGDLE